LAKTVALAAAAALTAGCGSAGHTTSADQIPRALQAQARPIGRAPRFHPPAAGPVLGPCRPRLGRRDGVHVELFARNRVVLIAAGIGTRPPRISVAGRLARARCYGALVTLEPTGVILTRPGAHLTLADLFRSWGQPLTRMRVGPFTAARGQHVTVFVNGHQRPGPPQTAPLARHAEIVLEVGPHVPPHPSYRFPPGT
jgi:hypothetical protein